MQGRLGARFLNLTPCEMQLLQHSIEDWQPSTMTIKEPSRHLQKSLPDTIPVKTERLQFRRSPWQTFRLKTLVVALIYVGVGGGIVGLSLAGVARSINTMEIRSAAIAKPVEPIVAAGVGMLNAVYVQPSMAVQAGQALFQVNQPDAIDRELKDLTALSHNKIDNIDHIRQQIALSQIELAEAQAGLARVKSFKQQETARLKSYEAIAHSNLNTSRSKVQALQVQYRMTQNQLQRMAILLQEGAISQQEFDVINSKLAALEGELSTAQENLNIAQTTNASVRNGSFYDGQQLIGELPRLTTEVEDWQHKVQLAVQKTTVLQRALHQQEQDIQRLERKKQVLHQVSTNGKTAAPNPLSMVYHAPFAGSVVKVMKSKGNTINQGETVVILQRDSGQDVQINAYLTQDQADQTTIGARAKVSIPSLGQQYQAQVVEIDRTGGFEDPVRGRYQFSGSNDQSAYVKLKLVNLKQADQHPLKAGTPVILQFVKKANILTAFFNR